MFPTISDLIQYLTHLQLPLPFQTFGTLMALAFGGAYWAYRHELKRKEAEGVIKAIKQNVGPLRWPALFAWSLLAGMVAAKLVIAGLHYRSFAAHPTRIVWSGLGHWPAGITTAMITAFVLWQKKRHTYAQTVLVHPYQMMPALLWWCGLVGFAGAVLFHQLDNANGEGVSYYGGLLCGIAVALYMAHHHKIPLIHMLDMGSPAMMLAYGIGRFGCHLSGDGDWGIVNNAPMPAWLSILPSHVWACSYPMSDLPVFPTSLYEGICCLLLFAALWLLRRRITTPGKLFAIYCLMNGAERLLAEQIKINPVLCIGFIRCTQAELISTLFILTGLVFLLTIAIKRNRRMNSIHTPVLVSQ